MFLSFGLTTEWFVSWQQVFHFELAIKSSHVIRLRKKNQRWCRTFFKASKCQAWTPTMKIKINMHLYHEKTSEEFTKGEHKCPDFLPSFSPWRPFAVQNNLSDFLLSFFACWPNWRTKKDVRLFTVLLVTFWRPKLKKDGKRPCSFFCPPKGCQKDTKRSQG